MTPRTKNFPTNSFEEGNSLMARKLKDYSVGDVCRIRSKTSVGLVNIPLLKNGTKCVIAGFKHHLVYVTTGKSTTPYPVSVEFLRRIAKAPA